MAVAIQADSTFEAGQPQTLFEPRIFGVPIIPYTVSADGQRFLVNSPVEEVSQTPITVVINWTSGFKK